jgi:magnesium transporter
VFGEFGLHPLAVEDGVKAHQRPKLGRYDGTVFLVLRPTRHLYESQTVEFGEVHVCLGPGFVVTVRHGRVPALGKVRRRLEGGSGAAWTGPEAILYAITDRVVDGYVPVWGLENDIHEIEDEVFSSNPASIPLHLPASSSPCFAQILTAGRLRRPLLGLRPLPAGWRRCRPHRRIP